MQLFIVFTILALAVAYTLWRVVRMLRGRGDCGCGCGDQCPHNKSKHNAARGKCHNGHCSCRAIVMLLSLAAVAAQAGNEDQVIAQMARDIRLLPYTELHHLVVMRDGRVLAEAHAEPFRANDPHNQYSACKLLTGLAVGLAIDDGKLRLDDRVIDSLDDQAPRSRSRELEAMTVRHLLTMTSGMPVATAIRDTSTHWMQAWLAMQPQAMPGKRMEYDTMTSFMLAALVRNATGRNILDLLNERILHPMGINDVEWELSPDSINTGGWGMRCSTMSMAKIGQLMLQRGQWQGRQLIAERWVDQMTTEQLTLLGIKPTHIDEFHDGYGYQVWLCGLQGAYRAQGNMGQLTLVYPAGRIVVAVNCATPYQGQVLRLVQRYAPRLVSAAAQPVELPPFELSGQPWTGDSVRVDLPENSQGFAQLYLQRQSHGPLLTILYDDGTTEQVALGYGQWAYTQANHTPSYNIGALNRFSGMNRGFTVAAQYACHTGGQLEIWLQYVDWGTGVRLLVDTVVGRVVITDNKAPNRHEVLSISNHKPVPKAASRWWIAGFAALFIALLALVARNSYRD